MGDYVNEAVRTEVYEAVGVRHQPGALLRLVRSIARNVATEAKIAGLAVDAGGDTPLARGTAADYLRALERIFVVETQPAWSVELRSRATLRKSPKIHFVDPSLAASSLRASPGRLLADPETLGLLFESLVVRDLRVYSQAETGSVYHYRDNVGLEADAVVERNDGAWLAAEAKLSPSPRSVDAAAASLLRLRDKLSRRRADDLAALLVVTSTGRKGRHVGHGPARRPGRAARRHLHRHRLPPQRRSASSPHNRPRPLIDLGSTAVSIVAATPSLAGEVHDRSGLAVHHPHAHLLFPVLRDAHVDVEVAPLAFGAVVAVVVGAVVGDGRDPLQLHAETAGGLRAQLVDVVLEAGLAPHVGGVVVEERRRRALAGAAQAVENGGLRHGNDAVLVGEARRRRSAQIERERHAALRRAALVHAADALEADAVGPHLDVDPIRIRALRHLMHIHGKGATDAALHRAAAAGRAVAVAVLGRHREARNARRPLCGDDQFVRVGIQVKIHRTMITAAVN
ncbi:MAG: DUF4143 domain-containing protein [Acidimicrobiaceae bacterium]|nr:DUF4143 domain-containing protein [Acidimicrobiaceae bacterium]MYE75437.1 DUF4143 domain-containing protein [Acidimicrobiaceae bacterium]MYH42922.1 DUF4143 domain-containing protein [Acidimicrobiaceae bacterium]MYJ41480.1 DUF4143 domain-containing protein [Acidimicrobiaceae bacterium]